MLARKFGHLLPAAIAHLCVGLVLCSMNKRLLIASCLLVLTGVAALLAQDAKHSVAPKDGFVPDAKTAIKIAVAVWEPIYGEAKIAGEKPYKARLHTNGVWTVEGSLPQGWVGGVAVAEVAKSDARILRVSHGK